MRVWCSSRTRPNFCSLVVEVWRDGRRFHLWREALWKSTIVHHSFFCYSFHSKVIDCWCTLLRISINKMSNLGIRLFNPIHLELTERKSGVDLESGLDLIFQKDSYAIWRKSLIWYLWRASIPSAIDPLHELSSELGNVKYNVNIFFLITEFCYWK